MPAPEDLRAFVRSWIDTAASDVEAARVLLDNEQIDPAVAAYHVQQATEKALKAILYAVEAGPPRAHNLRSCCAGSSWRPCRSWTTRCRPRPALSALGFRGPGRYPDSGFGLTWEPDEIKDALRIARRVVDLAREFAAQSGG